MYSASDPRSKLGGGGPAAAPASPYGDAASMAYAAAEYVKFHEVPPAESSASASTWYARGQNFVIAYTEAKGPTVLTRERQVDEYVLLLPAPEITATVKAGGETKDVRGYSIVIVPPGPSTIEISGGTVVRVISTRNEDAVAKCSNAASYAQQHPNIPPFQPWPDPPGGFRIRAYSLDVPPQEGRFGRIWRCTTMMINFLP